MQWEAIRDPVGVMEDAKALLQIASRLEPRLSNPDLHLPFRGRFLACAILPGLAAELALKELIMRNTSCTPKCHDLVKLFDRLPEKTKQGLERRMPGNPDLAFAFPPVGIRGALEANRNLFVEWRYLHERRSAHAETGVLKTAMVAMIDAFLEPDA